MFEISDNVHSHVYIADIVNVMAIFTLEFYQKSRHTGAEVNSFTLNALVWSLLEKKKLYFYLLSLCFLSVSVCSTRCGL